MPHVASDWKSHGLSRLQQQAGKQPNTSSPQAKTPFDSILDETTRPDPAPRKQRAADNNSPRADRTPRARSTDRQDKPGHTAKSDDRATPSDAPAAAKSSSAADAAKAGDAAAKSPDGKTADAVSGETNDKSATTDSVSAADAGQQPAGPAPADAVGTQPVAVVIDPAAALAPNIESADTNMAGKVEPPGIPAIAAAAETPPAEIKPSTAPTTAPGAAEFLPANAAKDTSDAPAATLAPVASAAKAAAVEADAAGHVSTAAAQAQANAPGFITPKAGKTEQTNNADLKSDKKADADTKTASAPTTLKPAPALDASAAQSVNGEPAKDIGTHVRADAAAGAQRGLTADAAPATAASDLNAIAATAKTPDLAPPPGLTVQTPAQAIGAPTATVAPTSLVPSDSSEPAVPIAGVAFEITSKVLSGRNQFDIRLDPPDLGRIHVRMDVDRDGNVITHMVADRTDTLDMLRKDTAGLERALQDAGLKTSDNSLQFSLRDQQANQQQRDGGGESAQVVIEDEQLASIDPAQRTYARYNAATGGLDIRV